MRLFEYRIYTLRTREAFEFYSGVVYPRHLCTFPMFGVEPHGFWTAKDDDSPRLHVLVSYAPGDDPAEVSRRFMESSDFAEDTRDFDVSTIVNVESTILSPSTGSPLR